MPPALDSPLLSTPPHDAPPDAALPISHAISALSLSAPSPSWLEDLVTAQERDSSLGGFRSAAHRSHADFTLQPLPAGELLLFRGKPVVPKDTVPLVL